MRIILNYCTFVGFEIVTAVVMKSTIFWDKTPCSRLKFNRLHGGGKYRLHLQGQRISRARNQRESRWQGGFYSGFLLRLFFETSVEFQRTAWRYILEDSTLYCTFIHYDLWLI
jgi:hypothetical protein